MFGFGRLSVVLASDDDIRRDFHTEVSGHPYRCAKCSRMQPRGSSLAWVSDSANFFDTDGYDRLAVASSQDDSGSGWCFSCVAKTKLIPDDFVRPHGWVRSRGFLE